MTNSERVLYLCFTQKGEEGFVFPSELEADEYNPGIFIIAGNYFYRLAEKYIFEAFDGESRIDTDLIRHNRNIYRVRTRHGIFFFRAKMIPKRYNQYFGRYRQLIMKPVLFELVPMQPERLETICRSSNFYFLGSIETGTFEEAINAINRR